VKRLSPIAAATVRGCGALIAPRGTLLVLIFHRVLPQRDPLLWGEPDVEEFATQMDVLRATCNVLPLSEGVQRLQRGSLPPRAACITFDDGYANNLTHAARVLRERRMPATVFVATGYLGGGRMWNDTVIEAVRNAGSELDLSALGLGRLELPDSAARRRAIESIIGELKYRPPQERLAKSLEIAARVGKELPADLMLTEPQVAELAGQGVEIGAHTVTHPILARIDAETAKQEICASKSALEAITRGPVRLFAYPNGRPRRDYEREHVDMVRNAGFDAAVSTAWGAAYRQSDLFQLPRMTPWERTPLRYAARLLYTLRQTRVESA
jgi:peptidoglycan/xylan/chitin deacetylase (PgdA/CDA1 family)